MSDPLAFLAGGGEAARMIRARDWSGHPLGPPEGWSAEFRSALSLVLNSPEGMILAWGPDLHVFFNDTYFPLLGPRLSRAMGERFDALWADNLDRTKPIIEDAMAGRPRRFVDLPWKLGIERDATPTWWTFSYSRVLDATGAAAGLVIFTSETTARVLSDSALRESEERYRLALRATNDAIWDWDFVTDHIVWNESLEQAYGHPLATVEPTGQWWSAHIHPDDRSHVETSIHTVMDGTDTSWSVEYRFRRADGSYAYVLDRGFVIRGADGKARRMIGAMLDLTERKRAEAALLRLNESLEDQVRERTQDRNALWQLSKDIMLRCTFQGVMTAVNPAWTEVLGWREDELIGANLFDFLHPEDLARTVEGARELSEGVGHARFDNRYRHKDGSYRWISWSTRPGEGLINAVGRDFTAEKERIEALEQAEEALRQSQKMEAVGQLTGGIAHDFNNLLAGISGSLELMQTRMSQGRLRDIDSYIVAAQGASKRAAALTHRLLAFSRRQTLDPQPTDVNALIGGMEELIRRTVGPSIAIEVVGAPGLWPALVDPPQLENALLNLCINARDAMPDGGRITIEAANRWLDRSAASQHDIPEGQYLSLCVTDTGTGMSPSVIAKAFDPFFTTKPIGQGTGLGLSMIYGFVKQSGGQVRIYSEVGQGTTVCIYLPRHHGDVEAADPLAETGIALRAQEGETVLVVDDEPTVRMLVTDVLEELGYTAIEAADSVAGLKILQSDVRIDLLVTDVGLPGGMNGRQMADAGREKRPDLKVLFVTGYAENAIIGSGHLEPGMQILSKPFAVETLGARIRELVGASH